MLSLYPTIIFFFLQVITGKFTLFLWQDKKKDACDFPYNSDFLKFISFFLGLQVYIL